MLRSQYCLLSEEGQDVTRRTGMGECEYDEGGYFIVNGVEKVLIAQERMSNNHVYVFEQPKSQRYSHLAECRSCTETGSRPTSTMYVYFYRSGKGGRTLRAQIPYIRDDIPIVIVFRALGFVADKEILEHIIYDLHDERMMELLKPSLEEASVIQSQNVALDFIGKRGISGVGVVREKRIKYVWKQLFSGLFNCFFFFFQVCKGIIAKRDVASCGN